MRIFTNTDNILKNIDTVKSQLCKCTKFCAVVKANAYGHGLEQVSKAIQNKVDYFAVARLDEALILRRCGVSKPVLVLNPYLTVHDVVTASKENITLTADSDKNISLFVDFGVKIHIKVDSGMGRIGVTDKNKFLQLLSYCKSLGADVDGIYSHFASDVNKNPKLTFAQYNKFAEFSKIAKQIYPHCIAHICNTAGALFCPAFHMDMVRVGIGLYGYGARRSLSLLQCKKVVAKVAETKCILKGQGVGYEHDFVANDDTEIAVVDCGYGDGLPRIYNGYVLAKGQKLPVIGKVCMDMMMIKNCKNSLQIGDEVVILGECDKNAIKADEIAQNCGTIPYEILCNLRER